MSRYLCSAYFDSWINYTKLLVSQQRPENFDCHLSSMVYFLHQKTDRLHKKAKFSFFYYRDFANYSSWRYVKCKWTFCAFSKILNRLTSCLDSFFWIFFFTNGVLAHPILIIRPNDLTQLSFRRKSFREKFQLQSRKLTE